MSQPNPPDVICPRCSSPCARAEIHDGGSVVRGPWGCACGWFEGLPVHVTARAEEAAAGSYVAQLQEQLAARERELVEANSKLAAAVKEFARANLALAESEKQYRELKSSIRAEALAKLEAKLARVEALLQSIRTRVAFCVRNPGPAMDDLAGEILELFLTQLTTPTAQEGK